jgi:SAM-dependent methyltransferase
MRTDQDKFYDTGRNFGRDEVDARVAIIQAFVRRSFEDRTDLARVLDVGCANGLALRSLPDHMKKVGLDVSRVLLDRAAAFGIETHHCDFDNNPFPLESASFDLVLCHDVIEHVLHTDHVLNEINRVLKPGGLLNLSVPNINQPVSLVAQFLLDLTPPFAARYRCTHYRDFTHRLFSKILKVHGFGVVRAEGSLIYPFEKSRLSRWVAGRIPRWGAHLLYLARKEQERTIPEDFAVDMPELLAWFKAQEQDVAATSSK